MAFLDQFTLYDVFLVAIGLATASIVRIFYDSYKERKKLEELDELVAVYNESMNAYDEGIIILSDNHNIVFSNKESHRILDVADRDLTTTFLNENVKIRIQNSLESKKLLDAIGEHTTIASAQIIAGQHTLPVALSSHTFHSSSMAAKNTLWRIIVMQDITGKVKLQEKIESTKLSTDMLTGLPVKHHLVHALHSLLASSADKQNASALGMLGISDYHDLQSQYGVEKIDSLFKSVVKMLSENLRDGEALYRFDHDSLAMIFEEISGEKESKERLLYFQKRMKDIATAQNIDIDTISAVIMIRKPYHGAEQLIDGCLSALYRKSVANPPKKESMLSMNGAGSGISPSERLGKQAFKNAIQNKDFFFFYQPIYDLKDDTLIGVEVLIRLNYKKEGLLLPGVFLEQAVACHMMTEVTSHLLDRVLSQKRFWSMQTHQDLDTTINLGISDIHSGIFTETLEKKIIEYGIDPSTITIDISEEILEVDYEAVFEECYVLNKLGVKLTIDHFGKGTVSLKHISKLPLHAIKIDGSVITGIEKKEENLRLASGIVSMGRKLDLEVGATFVDSDTVKMLLGRIGCRFAQGNYLGKAVPAFEISNLIHSP